MSNLLRISSLALLLALAPTAFASEAVNTDKTGIALGGYDATSYFTDGKPVKGDFTISAVHNGATYWFANQANKDTFVANPEKFAPAFGGYCAFGVTLSKKLSGDPLVWKIVDGKLYLNVNSNIAKLFDKDTAAHIATAEKNWPTIANRPAAEVNK
jgi:YHS domain-containing protein